MAIRCNCGRRRARVRRCASRSSVLRATIIPSICSPGLRPRRKRCSGVAKPRLGSERQMAFSSQPGADSGRARTSRAGPTSRCRASGSCRVSGQAPAAAGYRLRFAVPADWAGHRVKLRFDAVYSKADVWMNGTPVGSHLGAFTPFELDVTRAILPGKENVLALAVASDSLADALTVGLEMVGHPMGGIIRKVSMFAVPEVNVSSLHVETIFDRQYRNAVLRVLVDVANESAKAAGGTALHFTLREYGAGGASGQPQPGNASSGATESCPARCCREVIEIPVDAPKKWDAEHPNLYVLDLRFAFWRPALLDPAAVRLPAGGDPGRQVPAQRPADPLARHVAPGHAPLDGPDRLLGDQQTGHPVAGVGELQQYLHLRLSSRRRDPRPLRRGGPVRDGRAGHLLGLPRTTAAALRSTIPRSSPIIFSRSWR